MFYVVRFKSRPGKPFASAKFRTWDDKVIDATPSLDKFIGKSVMVLIDYLRQIDAEWAVSQETTLDTKKLPR